MAFLGAPVRWPDALPVSYGFDSLATRVRPYLPAPLNTLPSSLLVSILLTVNLLFFIALFSSTLNSRRKSLVPAQSATREAVQRRKPGQQVTALLVGPEQTGKSAIYSALVFQAVPETQTSQHENESKVNIEAASSSQDEKMCSLKTPVHLVDLPGHPRIRSKVNEFLPVADKIVFCVDTATAIRGGSSKNDTLIEAVDQFHATLTALARNRLSRSSSKAALPPSLLVLFTRGDLSPLLAAAPSDTKRQAQVISRARAAFEAELGRRRAGMGLGRGSSGQPRAKVGGMSKVVGGSPSGGGWLTTIKSMLGLGYSGSSKADEQDDDDDEGADAEDMDYVDWAWAQRAASSSGGGSSAAQTSFNLDKLDADVIMDGKAAFAVASVGKERGWAALQKSEDAEGPFEGLKELRAWLAGSDV